MSVLASITRLRQLALDPALVEESYIHVGSAKVEYVADRLDEIVPLGHRALIFSQFTSFLARIRHVLERRGVSVVQLDGSTRNRTEVIERFRSGEAPVLPHFSQAGGSGLTLTEAGLCLRHGSVGGIRLLRSRPPVCISQALRT